MKLSIPYDISGKLNKIMLVQSISGLIEGNRYQNFEPYRPNEHDWDFWTLDSGNNWKIKFERDTNNFEIWYRYDKDGRIAEKFINWLTFKLGVVILEK